MRSMERLRHPSQIRLGHDVIGLDVPPDGFADDLQRLVFPGLLRALRLEDRVVCIPSNASRHSRSQLDK